MVAAIAGALKAVYFVPPALGSKKRNSLAGPVLVSPTCPPFSSAIIPTPTEAVPIPSVLVVVNLPLIAVTLLVGAIWRLPLLRVVRLV